MLSASISAQPGYEDVAAILEQRCVICHSGPAAPRGLRLDTLEGIRAGSDRGDILTPGDPGNSELIRRLTGESQPRMPMTGPPYLSEAEIDMFRDWIRAGTPGVAATTTQPDAAPSPGPAPEATTAPVPDDAAVLFSDVAPIFAKHCAKCHTENGLMGAPPEGYILTSYDAVLSTADRARVVPGNPAASELVRRIRGQALPRMPFDGPPYLAPDEIALVERWIRDGARNSAGEAAPPATGARVRLHGELVEFWQLDDLPLATTRRTRIDKDPRPGDQVRVRGRVQADGSIRAERIRRD